MPLTDHEIRDECEMALADARLPSERVRFYRLAGLSTEGGYVGAAWFEPFTDIGPHARGFPNDEDQRADANRDEHRALHRITVPAEPHDRATFAAVVRHELEHARHYDADVGVGALHDFIEGPVLLQVARDLDGCGNALINSLPDEIDCNAAASVYLTSRFGEPEIQAVRKGPKSNLACSLIPPAPPKTLPARMVAFMFVYRQAVERYAERQGQPVATILGRLHPYAPDLWARLEEGLRPPST